MYILCKYSCGPNATTVQHWILSWNFMSSLNSALYHGIMASINGTWTFNRSINLKIIIARWWYTGEWKEQLWGISLYYSSNNYLYTRHKLKYCIQMRVKIANVLLYSTNEINLFLKQFIIMIMGEVTNFIWTTIKILFPAGHHCIMHMFKHIVNDTVLQTEWVCEFLFNASCKQKVTILLTRLTPKDRRTNDKSLMSLLH